MDDIDDELRRLFNDDRLDVHVTPDATDSVVRGANRRRRRRAATAGTFAIVALIGAGVGLTQLRPSEDDSAGPLMPTSSSAATTTPPPSVSTYTQTVTVTVDPPTGSQGTTQGGSSTPKSSRPSTTSTPPKEGSPGVWGKLALGMSEENALKTGSLTNPGEATGSACRPYAMQTNLDSDAVLISPARGIVRIKMPSTARTSKNIGAGSTVAELKAAYPGATENGSELVVQMTATPRWAYVFDSDGTVVTAARMRLADQDCPGA
ncbi:hypothetical protein [Lentzea sp.]|uniref:hypothetical protein n=1 Tax=Lentzea sp. TaxID=56099 RepID=UPI002ED3290E